MKRVYSLKIIPEKKEESFSPSYCDCKQCKSMKKSDLEWNIFKQKTSIKTPLQIRMIKVVSKIESDIKKRKII